MQVTFIALLIDATLATQHSPFTDYLVTPNSLWRPTRLLFEKQDNFSNKHKSRVPDYDRFYGFLIFLCRVDKPLFENRACLRPLRWGSWADTTKAHKTIELHKWPQAVTTRKTVTYLQSRLLVLTKPDSTQCSAQVSIANAAGLQINSCSWESAITRICLGTAPS